MLVISCVVPVYNNSKTIKHVITTLLSVREINELIAVDDCSNDSSAAILKKISAAKLKKIYNGENMGKGGAVARGINAAKGEVLLFCDADLALLRSVQIKQLIRTFNENDYDMVIAADETDSGWWNHLMAIVSGQRILYRKNLNPYLNLISKSGNGIEQITNFAHHNLRVKIIIFHKIGHILKYQREDKLHGLFQYIQEGYQLLKTEAVLRSMEADSKILNKAASLYLNYNRQN